MKTTFSTEIDRVLYLAHDVERFHYLTSVIRSMLQYATYTAVEYWQSRIASTTHVNTKAIRSLLKPSDGTFRTVLDMLLPEIRSHGWSCCATPWFQRTLTVTASEPKSLVEGVTQWVQFRNQIYHGVAGADVIQEHLPWLEQFAKTLCHGLEDLLPEKQDGSDKLTLKPFNQEPLEIETSRLVDGYPIIIRNINRRGSAWRVQYQLLDLRHSPQGHYELETSSPFVKACLNTTDLYRSHTTVVGREYWCPSVSLPQRQTTVFQGREFERGELSTWMNDLDSRACLIYGEGGIGKTTLVLEYLNELLEYPPDSLTWHPEVICFYSAKLTRWGPQGLEYIRGVSPAVSDAVRHLVQLLEDTLDRAWFSAEPRAIIDRAAQLFRSAGVDRNQILLILDNTETLTRTSAEELEMTKLLRQLSSHLCRLIMTSKRRERVEAFPIEVLPMNDEEGSSLLMQLGVAYDAQAIKQAGSAKLRKISRQLSGRPLLLDTFARYAAIGGRALDDALRLVFQDNRGDLGEFLYDDGWQRISPEERRVFLVLGRFSDTFSGQVVGRVCSEVGIPHQVWLNAFEATKFGSLSDYGTDYDIHFDVSMREFLAKKFSQLRPKEAEQINVIATQVKKWFQHYLQANDMKISEKDTIAYKTSAAKAARLAAQSGNFEDAFIWYDEAVSVDPRNAVLWERYASFLLLKMKKYQRAMACILEAYRLAPDNADICFLAGTIAGHLQDIASMKQYLEKAERLGYPGYLCLLQSAKSHVEIAQDPQHSERLLSLECAEKLLLQAKAELQQVSPKKANKHLLHLEYLENRLADVQTSLR